MYVLNVDSKLDFYEWLNAKKNRVIFISSLINELEKIFPKDRFLGHESKFGEEA